MAKKHGLGKYSLLEKFIKEYHSLKKCDAEELEKLPGIGCKTARFFLINTRANYRCAVIDTYIADFISENILPIKNKKSFSKSQYLFYESTFLEYCDKNNLNPQEFDLFLWKQSSKKPKS